MSEPPSTRATDVEDLSTARALIATLHDQLTTIQRENAALPHQLDVLCLAHVIVSKYVDHLPLYRLEQIFAREQIDLSRTTLCEWVAAVATALAPIGEQLRREITATDYLHTDDTSITVLADHRGGSYKGRLWTYLDPIGRQVIFDATPTHERDGPDRFLADFRGKLQADAYRGYDALYATGVSSKSAVGRMRADASLRPS